MKINNIGFIGAGKVGFSLGKYFSINNLNVTGYYSQNRDSSFCATNFTNSTNYTNISDLVRDSDVIFITVPDSQIKIVWNQIKILPLNKKIICHCSGSLSTAIFSDITNLGAFGYSIHPFYAINSKYQSFKELSQILFTIEGDNTYIDKWQELFISFGNRVQIIDKDSKILYHTAAVMASNQVIALCKISIDLLKDVGFSETDATEALSSLMMGNIKNIASSGIIAALTGPIERNDIDTVANHINALSNPDKHYEDTLEIYKLLSKFLIDIAREKNPDKDYNELLHKTIY